MKTKAVRIHGKMDLRLDTVDLPPVGPDDVRVKIISDSICMSTYKAAVEGGSHKRVPDNVEENPTIVGHEFCGVIDEVGENWKHKYRPGQGFAIQPAHYYKGSQMAPGYSYPFCGGDAQYGNIPIESLLMDCLLPYDSDVYFYGSLAEPMSCIVGTFHAMYHTTPGSYEHKMGIVEGGKMAMLASVGAMGLGYDDVICFAPVRPVVEQADAILGFDGCLNFFAGPTDSNFKAEFNFYNVHYLYTHVVGTSGGNTSDMKEAIEMMTSGRLNPATMLTHIGGLNAVVDTTLNLPNIKGGKKLIYTQIELPLTAIADFEKLGENDPLFAKLAEITARHNGLWSPEAEKYLLQAKA